MESLRIHSPVGGFFKSAMEGGITVGGYYVPGGTQLLVSGFAAVCAELSFGKVF